MGQTCLSIAMNAYMGLLAQPMDEDRLAAQGLLASLRDFIAERSGRSAEEVQNQFEADAARFRR